MALARPGRADARAELDGGESVADIERLLADEPEALARLREELVGPEGAPKGNTNAKKTTNDNIISCSCPDLFTSPPEKPKRQKKTAPELFEEVKAGRGHLANVP